MNEKIRVPENKYFNKSFKDLLYKFFGSQINSQKFKEINFAYLFNLPSITNERKIRINQDIENFKWDRDLINNIEIRKKQIFLQLQKEGYNLENFSLSLSWRLIIGLGASHPQETSMTLHHIYGIPYIPGSAIKGVTRHWAVFKFAEEISKRERKDFEKAVEEISNTLENGKDLSGLKVRDFEFSQLIEILGTQEKQGRVIFFDAYPVGEINLKIDIMNPHYPKYYDGKEPPADWDSPMPIKFLSLENTTFRFYLATKVRDDFEKNLLNKARELLFEALSNFGIGAKTSLGYGLFKNNL
jgi:CRISPR-associated protein Cmr6